MKDRKERLDALSKAQISALACQNDIVAWRFDHVNALRCALLKLTIIKGLETNEIA